MVERARDDAATKPALAAIACDEAFRLAENHPDGPATALEALHILASCDPGRADACAERRVDLWQKQFNGARGEERKHVGLGVRLSRRVPDALQWSPQRLSLAPLAGGDGNGNRGRGHAMVDLEKVEEATRLLIEGIGEDPNRTGLEETPRRVARMWQELVAGMDQTAEAIVKAIPLEEYDEIILLRDIPFVSVCEHHLVPFIGKAHVAYLPAEGKVTGLSKLCRIVEMEARKLQIQERMTTAIADDIMTTLDARGVMVVVEAEHLCMTIRGAQKPGTITVTSVVRGLFRENQATRAEALALLAGGRRPLG